MPDDRPGWGIRATGGIAATFTDDLRDGGRRVVAVGSRTVERAEAFAAAPGVPHAHGSWTALVEDPEVDVVYVSTPHPQHAEAARLALEHGKHVLAEKPFTLNEAEARAVQTLAAERGLIALEAMWTRWLPHMLEIHALLDAGVIGEVRQLVVDHTQALSDDPRHRMNAPELGGGVYEALEMERLIREGRTESERMTRDGTVAVMRTLDRIRAEYGLVYPQETAG